MNRLLRLLTIWLFCLLPELARASEGAGTETEVGKTLSLWWVSFFVLMLLAIAILPLATPHWFHPNRNKLLVSAVLGLPVLGFMLYMAPHKVLHTAQEYVSFIILLTSLFIISGGILVRANLRATPLVNTAFLAIGSVLASFMGTTGAAMLLVRPLLSTNKERTKKVHTIIFFTFLVANIGGCLTPLGDPPLFMGYLAGVPFSWTFRLAVEWISVVGFLLLLYFIIDSIMFAKEPIAALKRDQLEVTRLAVSGHWLNIPLLAGVVLSVAFLTEHVAPFPVREAVLIALALASWFGTPKEVRQGNNFTFYPILEVAALFAGIFATMIPPIMILEARGAELGVNSPASFFWATGALSSFLDNTPTYVVFFSLAKGLGVPEGAVGVAGVEQTLLVGISLGAVFFGANTYIGNAPNFMVKSISEEQNIRMPSFFGYMLWAIAILIPTFLGVTFIFLRG